MKCNISLVVEIALLALFCTAPLGAQAVSKNDYVGAENCGSCHPDKLAKQSVSEHAHALSRPFAHALAKNFVPDKTFVRSGKFKFQFFRKEQKLYVRASDDSRQIDIPIDWAFGAGSQGVTFVTRINPESYIEHSLSYYPAASSYSSTPGQPVPAEDSLRAALGKLFRSNTEMRNCFQCHSTGPVALSESGWLEPLEMGVRCESCHGPGRSHIEAAKSGRPKQARSAIKNPARMNAKQLILFCGTCHRQPAAPGSETDWKVSWNVRHQPVYLNQADCFRKSSGALSCLTCHDPHSKLETSKSSYNSKCMGCHTQNTNAPAATCVSRPNPDCVGCHMPRVSPQSFMSFANHWIGIYQPGDGLKPVPRRSAE